MGLARLGRDAEVKDVSDTPVCNLSLAFNYGRKGEDGKRPTQWVDGALWGKQAESLAPYLKKGGMVFVVLSDVHVQAGGDGKSYLKARVDAIEFAGNPSGASGSADKPSEKKVVTAPSSQPDDDLIPF